MDLIMHDFVEKYISILKKQICALNFMLRFKGIVSGLTIKFWMCQKMWQNERL
jgi:hypothetical protein